MFRPTGRVLSRASAGPATSPTTAETVLSATLPPEHPLPRREGRVRPGPKTLVSDAARCGPSPTDNQSSVGGTGCCASCATPVCSPPIGQPSAALGHDRAITGITQRIALPVVSVNNVVVGAIAGQAIRGPLLLSTVAGHQPTGTGEVGLGVTTMRQVGARIGSLVNVTVSLASGGSRTVPFRVVSQMSLPVLGNAVSLGTGAVFTLAGYEDAAFPPGPERAACQQRATESSNGGVLACVVPGSKGQTAINHYFDSYRWVTTLAIAPTSLINFGEAVISGSFSAPYWPCSERPRCSTCSLSVSRGADERSEC